MKGDGTQVVRHLVAITCRRQRDQHQTGQGDGSISAPTTRAAAGRSSNARRLSYAMRFPRGHSWAACDGRRQRNRRRPALGSGQHYGVRSTRTKRSGLPDRCSTTNGHGASVALAVCITRSTICEFSATGKGGGDGLYRWVNEVPWKTRHVWGDTNCDGPSRRWKVSVDTGQGGWRGTSDG